MSPDLLPSIPKIRRVTQSLAMLDAILCPEWEYRYYSFDRHWGQGEEMASMRNGCGDDWFLLLDAAGAALMGYAHELADDAELPQNIQAQVPADFASFLNEPAFSMERATFCYWRQTADVGWSKVSSSLSHDGSDDMLPLIVSEPAAYKTWAEEYYEVAVSLAAVEALFSHQPLDDALILALNPDADLSAVYAEADAIGYPTNVV
jgi:hypothetical protein